MTTPHTTTNPPASADDDGNPPIAFATDEEKNALIRDAFAAMRRDHDEHRAAADAAIPALERLCQVLRGRSGQPYKVRALFYSLWNGQPTSLVEIVALDWAIRKDLCAVLLAFGFEDRHDETRAFFYDAITAALQRAGQYEWFLEAHQESEVAA